MQCATTHFAYIRSLYNSRQTTLVATTRHGTQFNIFPFAISIVRTIWLFLHFSLRTIQFFFFCSAVFFLLLRLVLTHLVCESAQQTLSFAFLKTCRRHTDIPLNDRAIYFSIIIFFSVCSVASTPYAFATWFGFAPPKIWATWSRCRRDITFRMYHKEIVSRWKKWFMCIMSEKTPSISPINI